MPKKKWIDHEEWARQREPHASSYPGGLWWWRALSPEERPLVLEEYLRQRGRRGLKKAGPDFDAKLESWIWELTLPAKERGKKRYWTLKSYALANRIPLHPFMAWFRKLEEVAKKLYPNRVPEGRRDRPPLSEKEIQDIREEYLNASYSNRNAVKEIAARHNIAPFMVGRLCRKEKEQRKLEIEEPEETQQSAATTSSLSPSYDFTDDEY